MDFNPLTALSPLDGRYAGKVDALRTHFSEFGLIKSRLKVEIEWLKALSAEPHFTEIAAFSASTVAELDSLVANFGPEQAAEVKAIEATTNHDVKALEYWIKDKTKANAEVVKVSEFIHFACTSEDINNLSHALMCQGARQQAMLPMLEKVIAKLVELAHAYADIPMNAYLQLSVPDEFRGRVNSVVSMIGMGVMPIGMLLAGVMVEEITILSRVEA